MKRKRRDRLSKDEKLEKRIGKLQRRMYEIGELLLQPRYPKFNELVSERNSLSVKIEVLKQQRNGQWTPPNVQFYSIPKIN